MESGSLYQSPLASPLLPSWLLLAAAEAKLDVRGEGIMARVWTGSIVTVKSVEGIIMTQ